MCNKHSRFRKKHQHLLSKYLFPFIAAGSFIWFLIRVIPKPSRASYPCMRVAAPLASSFVLWLLGTGTTFAFLKQARLLVNRSQYFRAVFIVLIGSIAGGILVSSHDSPVMAELKTNAPIGIAKGAQPGRVIWVYDTSVSNWEGLGDGHWWQNNHTNQKVVDQMISKTICSLSGKTTDSAAWDTLFRYHNWTHKKVLSGYTPGEKIVLKTNLTFCNHYPEFCSVDTATYSMYRKIDYMSTSPQVVLSVLRQLVYVVGFKQQDISVGDPIAVYPNEYYDYCHSEFPEVNYLDYYGKFGRKKVEISDKAVYWSCRPEDVKQDFVPKTFSEATYLINIANMKSHLGAGVTMCAKNHYGSLIRLPTENGYYDLHQSLAFQSPEMKKYRALVDIMGHKHLGGKTLLYLIDGLYAGNHNHDTVPHQWPAAPFNGNWTSSVFGSQDPVAIESVVFDIFQLDNDKYQYHKIAGAQDYLMEAAMADNPPSGTFYDPNNQTPTERLSSLGVFEHWNNPTDMKYSRNLGTGNGIELLFFKNSTSSKSLNRFTSTLGKPLSIHQLGKTNFIEFFIDKQSVFRIQMFDLQGKIIGNTYTARLSSGKRCVDICATINNGRKIPAGVYTLKVTDVSSLPHESEAINIIFKSIPY